MKARRPKERCQINKRKHSQLKEDVSPVHTPVNRGEGGYMEYIAYTPQGGGSIEPDTWLVTYLTEIMRGRATEVAWGFRGHAKVGKWDHGDEGVGGGGCVSGGFRKGN